MEDLQKKLDIALARIAALESSKEKPAPKPSTPRFDPIAMEANPIDHLKELGVNIDHITKHVVRNALGDQAPQHLKDYADQGRQLVATKTTLESKIEQLAGQVESLVGGSRRESFKTLATDRSKYPHLAAAYAVDPDSFGDLQGDPAEIATKLETQYAKLASAFKPQPASAAAADTIAQGQQAKPATADALQGTPPPIVQPKTAVVSDDVYAQLKAETVSKYETKV